MKRAKKLGKGVPVVLFPLCLVAAGVVGALVAIYPLQCLVAVALWGTIKFSATKSRRGTR